MNRCHFSFRPHRYLNEIKAFCSLLLGFFFFFSGGAPTSSVFQMRVELLHTHSSARGDSGGVAGVGQSGEVGVGSCTDTCESLLHNTFQ